MFDLPLLGVTHADHRLLHGVRRILPDGDPGLRRHEHRDAARLTELQRAGRVLVDEGLLHGRGVGREPRHDLGQLRMEAQEPDGQVVPVGAADPVGDMDEPASRDVDHTPAKHPQPRVDAQHPHFPPCSCCLCATASTKREHLPTGNHEGSVGRSAFANAETDVTPGKTDDSAVRKNYSLSAG